jgi:hypothetical protein
LGEKLNHDMHGLTLLNRHDRLEADVVSGLARLGTLEFQRGKRYLPDRQLEIDALRMNLLQWRAELVAVNRELRKTGLVSGEGHA